MPPAQLFPVWLPTVLAVHRARQPSFSPEVCYFAPSLISFCDPDDVLRNTTCGLSIGGICGYR